MATWQPTSTGYVNINVDATVVDSLDFFEVGVVGKNEHGVARLTIFCCILGRFSPQLVEMYVVHEDILAAREFQWLSRNIKTYALSVIHAIQQPSLFSMEAPLVSAI